MARTTKNIEVKLPKSEIDCPASGCAVRAELLDLKLGCAVRAEQAKTMGQ